MLLRKELVKMSPILAFRAFRPHWRVRVRARVRARVRVRLWELLVVGEWQLGICVELAICFYSVRISIHNLGESSLLTKYLSKYELRISSSLTVRNYCKGRFDGNERRPFDRTLISKLIVNVLIDLWAWRVSREDHKLAIYRDQTLMSFPAFTLLTTRHQ